MTPPYEALLCRTINQNSNAPFWNGFVRSFFNFLKNYYDGVELSTRMCYNAFKYTIWREKLCWNF